MSSVEEALTPQQVTETVINTNDSVNNEASSSSKQKAEKTKKHNNRGRNKKKNPNVLNATEAGTPKKENTTKDKSTNKKHKRKTEPSDPSSSNETKPIARITKNRAQGRLTDPQDDAKSDSSTKHKKKENKSRKNKQTKSLPAGDHDMATLLSHELKTSTYECMICMDVIRAAHPIWSCDCCWAMFHLDCIQTWATRSLKDTSTNKMITGWRCPGCQNSRTAIPRDYLCFCGKQRNPESSRYSTPHSCDKLCKKHKNCPHKCVLPCHPGPCPPCSSMGPVLTCYCGRTTRQSRCIETDYSTKGFSCADICDELLGCGKHRCEDECHAGICPPCELQEVQSCYCGRHERTARCGSGKQVQLRGHIGYYSCTEKCDTAYLCGQHYCQKSCHPCTANSQVCPFDPSVIKTCPCGAHTIMELLAGKERITCTDPIPTCESVCNKMAVCGHHCMEKCHTGPCPPCQVTIEVLCRCQSTTFEDTCANVCEAAGGEPPLCDRVCRSMRNCGRHQCGVKCCPAMKVKGKRRPGTEFLHDCPLQCDQLLSCGIHRCQDKCHKGKCRPCLEATFEDVTCHCGRTRLEPPVRCGTKLPPCPHPCIRPNPCGHIRFLNHNCHPDNEPCPPCPVLINRRCLCGKTELKNVPCYRESPRCGRVCGKPLRCGKHICLKSCHNGPCLDEGEDCKQTCGGARGSCGHACQQKCHEGSCPEVEPCTARIKASCKCGQLTMEIPCNATSESSGSKTELECNDFCAKVLRNRRLAMALDIKRDDYAPGASYGSSPTLSLGSDTKIALSSDHLGYYDDSLREFYNQYPVWCRNIEITLIEFVEDKEKRTHHFKPMHSEQRRFIHRYAIHFNIATEAIDMEPKRSIILRKTIGICRVPPILLSKAARNPHLNRAPTTIQNAEMNTNGRSPLKQPINALYLSDMAFGLTKLELDADLANLLKIDNDTIPFTSKWVNENDAVVIPSISDAVSMDEKEKIIWQLKKIVMGAFTSNTDGLSEVKAARVDCCWINQKGEVTWSEKQLSSNTKPSSVTSKTTFYGKTHSLNSYDALKDVDNNDDDDDGWMKVGGNNPYKPIKDAWFEPLNKNVTTTTTISSSDEELETKKSMEEEERLSVKEECNNLENNTDTCSKEDNTNSDLEDEWETLLDKDD
ncbi:uncharacterized protein BX663DRAFT_560725 [Cokeromyces recurvatus]|uniref:uncharacterized protein n=1 Tax=Cokeromyces recurvatus TaxID=90255 RepID=UPI00221EB016|nr:uncharacterized protein BX663DRAFT_560725 [Cokeromyces recurvatus]KAI7903173.1 hypothetical protein BX663DRAFT_560725 [Cokeromyces recurvatus]